MLWSFVLLLLKSHWAERLTLQIYATYKILIFLSETQCKQPVNFIWGGPPTLKGKASQTVWNSSNSFLFEKRPSFASPFPSFSWVETFLPQWNCVYSEHCFGHRFGASSALAECEKFTRRKAKQQKKPLWLPFQQRLQTRVVQEGRDFFSHWGPPLKDRLSGLRAGQEPVPGSNRVPKNVKKHISGRFGWRPMV